MEPTTTQYIEIRKNRNGKDRPFIVGTRIRVQDIVCDHEQHGLAAEEIALQYPHITLAQVHSALAYYFDNKEEVWTCIKDDEAFADSMRGDFAEHKRGDHGQDANADSVSS